MKYIRKQVAIHILLYVSLVFIVFHFLGWLQWDSVLLLPLILIAMQWFSLKKYLTELDEKIETYIMHYPTDVLEDHMDQDRWTAVRSGSSVYIRKDINPFTYNPVVTFAYKAGTERVCFTKRLHELQLKLDLPEEKSQA